MRYVPLLLFPFILYNAFAFLIFAEYQADFREAYLISVTMPSGAPFVLTVATSIILLALVLLGVEVVKAARIGAGSIVDHVLATALFVAALLEFLLIRQAATGTFLVLTVIALLDLICGFAVSIRTAVRDVSLDVPTAGP
jgi:hypothetical protein